MSLGSFLRTAGIAAGNVIIAGTQQEQREANLEATRTSNEIQKLALPQQRQQIDSTRQLSSEVAAEFGALAADQRTPEAIAKIASSAEVKALAAGNFEGAKTMAALADNAQKRQGEALTRQAQQVTAAKETAAQAASMYEANPSPEAAQELVRQAIRAGVPAQSIPLTSAPEFAGWAKQMQTAPLSAKEHLDLLEKAREADLRAATQREVAKDKLEAQRQRDKETAMYREGMMQLRREGLELRRDIAASKAGGHEAKIGAIEQRTSDTIIRNAAQIHRVVDNLMALPSDATAGLFSKLKDGTATEAIIRAGGRVLTPEVSQAVEAIGAEMGLVVGQLVTAGAKGATQGIVDSFQKMTTPQVGDTDRMKLLRIANAVEITKLELSNIAKGGTPELEANRQALLKDLEKFPTTKNVIQSFPASERKQTMQDYGALVRASAKLRSEAAALPREGDTGGAVPQAPQAQQPAAAATGGGIPSGWSVQVK